MPHDIIDNRESYLAHAVRPLQNESVRAHFAVGYVFLSGFKAIATELASTNISASKRSARNRTRAKPSFSP